MQVSTHLAMLWWGIMAESQSRGRKFRKLEQLWRSWKGRLCDDWGWCLVELQGRQRGEGMWEGSTFTVTETTQPHHQLPPRAHIKMWMWPWEVPVDQLLQWVVPATGNGFLWAPFSILNPDRVFMVVELKFFLCYVSAHPQYNSMSIRVKFLILAFKAIIVSIFSIIGILHSIWSTLYRYEFSTLRHICTSASLLHFTCPDFIYCLRPSLSLPLPQPRVTPLSSEILQPKDQSPFTCH